MANKMLIDASHPEETRVVVLRGNKVQEFDFEAADKKPLRGNIYLAKVTRVEPSLQAAFVDYGGNRHGFLAFAEIHPDYYQIPVADRIALLEEESRAHRAAEEEESRPQGGRGRRSRRRHSDGAEKRAARDEAIVEPYRGDAPPLAFALEFLRRGASADGEQAVAPSEPVALAPPPAHETIVVDPSGYGVVETGAEDEERPAPEPDHELKARRQDERDAEREHELEDEGELSEEDAESEAEHDGVEEIGEVVERAAPQARRRPQHDEESEEDEGDDEADHVEHIGGDAMDEAPYRAARPRRQYKIQEVIKRRQVLLVQVVKEERGNKGAALTTYLSLAGRYSVLMPNTARGGGISRKITDGADRKRLKEIVHDLEVPEGMGVILRTAGATRTKAEVKRDFEYLLRLWESVRELTLRSSAPTLVYEEGSLIKRAIRDLYGRDVEEVIVQGDDAYREAKDFMRMLMPSHAKNVRQHREASPLFAEAGVEAQLDAMFSNQVTLKSGGYLVINQTEALVAIDVNSGRSTREHNIEDTALRTNLEAADEVARQLRLRDLAGLIVVDFIDMEEGRNNRSVERRLKDALKNDRARIQVGRISHFGLLEMSRQRIRAGVVEGSTIPCPHCAGAGAVRSTASIALHVLRVLEEALVKSNAFDISLRTRTQVALYILNQKRNHLQELERRFGVHITVAADDTLTGSSYHALERGEPASGVRLPPPQHLRVDSVRAEPIEEEDLLEEEPSIEVAEAEDEIDVVEEPRAPGSRREANGRSAFASDETDGEGEGEAAQRSRRRRRRRGRGGSGLGGGEQAFLPGADQPSDDALAFMANIAGAPAPAPEGGRRAERGARRHGGRWMRSTPLAAEFRDPSASPAPSFDPYASEPYAPAPADFVPQGDFAPASEPSCAPQSVAEFSAPPAYEQPVASAAFEPTPDVAPIAESVEAFVAPPAPIEAPAFVEAAPAAPIVQPAAEFTAPSEAPPPAAPRKQTEVVITSADPAAPKKGGWWQRAKITLGGGD
jgi:ribonuclease E